MADRSILIVFEHERIRIGERAFTERHWKLLSSWAERQDERYLEVWSDSVRFLQWVGVLEIDDLIIEVLPKVELDRSDERHDESSSKWRRILLSLLDAAGYFDLRAGDLARLELQHHTLLDILFEHYLDSVEGLLKEGLVKRYRSVSKNRGAIKGRIDYNDNLRRNMCHAERISTVASEYDRFNLPNRILKAAVVATARFAPTFYTRSFARSVAFDFPDWPADRIRPEDFDRVRIDNKSRRYEQPLGLAKLILSRQNPDLAAGSCRVFSLLFDMNVLWEAAIFARLRKECLTIPGSRVRAQRTKLFWESSEAIRKTVRADIIAESPTGKRTILDTKWKVMTSSKPADDDLKQIFVYNTLWATEDGFLVYPRVDDRTVEFGRYAVKVDGLERRCGILFADVDPMLWPGSRLMDLLEATL
ncbi:MAG: hypothetical protein AAGU26_01930 [bacterium]|jgi:5-methylcytosine-specific restriction enzyme subunit McrC